MGGEGRVDPARTRERHPPGAFARDTPPPTAATCWVVNWSPFSFPIPPLGLLSSDRPVAGTVGSASLLRLTASGGRASCLELSITGHVDGNRASGRREGKGTESFGWVFSPPFFQCCCSSVPSSRGRRGPGALWNMVLSLYRRWMCFVVGGLSCGTELRLSKKSSSIYIPSSFKSQQGIRGGTGSRFPCRLDYLLGGEVHAREESKLTLLLRGERGGEKHPVVDVPPKITRREERRGESPLFAPQPAHAMFSLLGSACPVCVRGCRL